MAKVMIFLEDPGAVSFLAGLEDALAGAGCSTVTLTAGRATVDRPDAIDTGSASAEALIDRHAPDALIVGTSENLDSLAFALTDVSRRRGIPTFGAVDSAANVAFRFRGRGDAPLEHAPDWLLLPDEATARGFREIGFAPDRIAVVGHPRLHQLAEMRSSISAEAAKALRAQIFADAGERPVVVFVAELSTGLGDDPFRRTPAYTLQGTSGSDRRTDIVAEELVRAARNLPENPWLVLRLHPKQAPDDLAALAPRFDQVSQFEPALDIVTAADLVTGMTSVLLAEAAVLGRPVLSIVPDPAERAWLGDLGDAIASVSDRAALQAALARWPEPMAPLRAASRPSALMASAVVHAIGRS